MCDERSKKDGGVSLPLFDLLTFRFMLGQRGTSARRRDNCSQMKAVLVGLTWSL